MVCEIYQKDEYNIAIKCPYNEGFLKELKFMIPHYERCWNTAEKIWEVEGKWAEKVKDLASEYFEEVIED